MRLEPSRHDVFLGIGGDDGVIADLLDRDLFLDGALQRSAELLPPEFRIVMGERDLVKPFLAGLRYMATPAESGPRLVISMSMGLNNSPSFGCNFGFFR